METHTAIALMAFVGWAASGQSAFEAASIRPAAKSGPTNASAVRSTGFKASTDPNLVRYANITLRPVLMRAFNLKSPQIMGPAWLDTEHYDIMAKLSEGTTQGQIPAMLQNLLAERFKMVVHWDTRKQRVYMLVAGRSGTHLKASKETAESVLGPDGAPLANSLSFADDHTDVNGVTLAAFADLLSKFLDSPVRDMTEIQGTFDITLGLSMKDLAGLRSTMAAIPPESITDVASNPSSIFGALQKLGLKLVPSTEQVKLLVVDTALKIPTEN